MNRRIIIIAIILLMTLFNITLFESHASCSEILLEKIQLTSVIPSGYLKGTMTHLQPDGTVYQMRVDLKTKEGKYYYSIYKDNIERQRILYSDPAVVWVFNNQSNKLLKKIGFDKYNTILNTNFSYQDLNILTFRYVFKADKAEKIEYKGNEVIWVRLLPLMQPSVYDHMEIFLDSNNQMPLKIDYYDSEKMQVKVLVFKKVIKGKQEIKGEKISPKEFKEIMDPFKNYANIDSFLPKKTEEKIKTPKIAEKRKPKTLKEIKEQFNRLDKITLYNGEIIYGAILSKGDNLRIYTTTGIKTIEAKKIRKFESM